MIIIVHQLLMIFDDYNDRYVGDEDSSNLGR